MHTILLADDNPHAQRMGSEILTEEGHHVVTVSDGDAALQFLAENRPALVLADIRMPGASGLDICRYVKSRPELQATKVILLRGARDASDSEEEHKARSDGVLHKPLDPDDLIRTVRALLDTTAPAPNGEAADQVRQEPATAYWEAAAAASASGGSPQSNTSPPPADPEGSSVASRGSPLAALVEQALQRGPNESGQRERVRAVVREVLEAATPAIIDQITDRVIDSLREES